MKRSLLILFSCLLALSLPFLLCSCSSIVGSPDTEKTIQSSSSEESDDGSPQRGLVASYESLYSQSRPPKSSYRVIELQHVSTDKAIETLSRVMPDVVIARNGDSNSIIVRGPEDEIPEIEKLAASMDRKIPQILIEGKVVEVSEDGLSDLGVVWGQEEGSFKFSISKTDGSAALTDDILATLNALVTSGKARVLASPKISALDGKEAEINIGSRIPYAVPASTTSTSCQWTVDYIEAGVNLKILPTVASDGTIISEIKPEVSNVSEWRTTSAGQFPVISTRNASVTVRMKDGETLVIGGLINETERENLSGLPILSSIPVVGPAFEHSVTEKTRTEVVFLITPHIMD